MEVARVVSRGSLSRGEKWSTLGHAHNLKNWSYSLFFSFLIRGGKCESNVKFSVQNKKYHQHRRSRGELRLPLLRETIARSSPCLFSSFLWFLSALGHRRHRKKNESKKIISKPRCSYRCPNATYISAQSDVCLLYTSPSPRDKRQSRMPSSA